MLQSTYGQKVNFSIYVGSEGLLFWCAAGNKAHLSLPHSATVSESGIFAISEKMGLANLVESLISEHALTKLSQNILGSSLNVHSAHGGRDDFAI